MRTHRLPDRMSGFDSRRDTSTSSKESTSLWRNWSCFSARQAFMPSWTLAWISSSKTTTSPGRGMAL